MKYLLMTVLLVGSSAVASDPSTQSRTGEIGGGENIGNFGQIYDLHRKHLSASDHILLECVGASGDQYRTFVTYRFLNHGELQLQQYVIYAELDGHNFTQHYSYETLPRDFSTGSHTLALLAAKESHDVNGGSLEGRLSLYDASQSGSSISTGFLTDRTTYIQNFKLRIFYDPRHLSCIEGTEFIDTIPKTPAEQVFTYRGTPLSKLETAPLNGIHELTISRGNENNFDIQINPNSCDGHGLCTQEPLKAVSVAGKVLSDGRGAEGSLIVQLTARLNLEVTQDFRFFAIVKGSKGDFSYVLQPR